MKLSENTLSILKNFSTINPNLVVKSGKELSTIAEAKNILAKAKVEEKFPSEFGIYDLNEFLSVVALVGSNPEIEFEDGQAIISDGKVQATYRFADASILTAPTKAITMPDPDVTLEISAEHLNQVRKAAGALGHSVVSIVSDGEDINLVVRDPKNSSSNAFSIKLDDVESSDVFDLQFLIANLKVLGGDYKVNCSSKLISQWINTNTDVTYYIALEKTSTFES